MLCYREVNEMVLWWVRGTCFVFLFANWLGILMNTVKKECQSCETFYTRINLATTCLDVTVERGFINSLELLVFF